MEAADRTCIIAEMLFYEDIDYINIADITSSVETYSLVRLDEVDIVVDVFQLYDNKEDLTRSSMSGRSNGNGGLEYREDDEIPQTTMTDLPNRDLDGLWKSCAGLFHVFKTPL